MSDHNLDERRVLVVEDEYMLAEDMRETLEAAGAIVLGPAASLEGALALLRTEATVDAATVDINLGGQASYPVADELLRRGIPFLFTTGYDPGAIPVQYQHITRCEKPVRVQTVRDVLDRVIHG